MFERKKKKKLLPLMVRTGFPDFTSVAWLPGGSTMPVAGDNAAAATELGTTPGNQQNGARQLLFGIFF
jgi:hypothetical protein